ncbi:MAG: type II toxin-antitoxin system prevent-host-death family antitoxin [Jatrophihabitantaceae bacterium]
MDVATTALRAHLSEWIDRARNGEEVIVTDRGRPVARLVGVQWRDRIEQLIAEGVLSPEEPAERPEVSARTRVKARGSVSDLIVEDRDRHR